VTVRGARASLPARKAKADVVLVAARYGDQGRLQVAKGYVRHDQVWTDVRLFDRQALIDMLSVDQKVATAALKDLATDFKLMSTLELKDGDGAERLVAKGLTSDHDDLGLPLF
jgi:hypothetical protein